MCVSGRTNNLQKGGETIKVCTKHKYLGKIVSSMGKIRKESGIDTSLKTQKEDIQCSSRKYNDIRRRNVAVNEQSPR